MPDYAKFLIDKHDLTLTCNTEDLAGGIKGNQIIFGKGDDAFVQSIPILSKVLSRQALAATIAFSPKDPLIRPLLIEYRKQLREEAADISAAELKKQDPRGHVALILNMSNNEDVDKCHAWFIEQAEREYAEFIQEEIQREQWAEQYQPTDTAFAINSEALTQPQQEYFAHVNAVIGVLGDTPQSFEERANNCIISQASFTASHMNNLVFDAMGASEKIKLAGYTITPERIGWKRKPLRGADMLWTRPLLKGKVNRSEITPVSEKVFPQQNLKKVGSIIQTLLKQLVEDGLSSTEELDFVEAIQRVSKDLVADAFPHVIREYSLNCVI